MAFFGSVATFARLRRSLHGPVGKAITALDRADERARLQRFRALRAHIQMPFTSLAQMSATSPTQATLQHGAATCRRLVLSVRSRRLAGAGLVTSAQRASMRRLGRRHAMTARSALLAPGARAALYRVMLASTRMKRASPVAKHAQLAMRAGWVRRARKSV